MTDINLGYLTIPVIQKQLSDSHGDENKEVAKLFTLTERLHLKKQKQNKTSLCSGSYIPNVATSAQIYGKGGRSLISYLDNT